MQEIIRTENNIKITPLKAVESILDIIHSEKLQEENMSIYISSMDGRTYLMDEINMLYYPLNYYWYSFIDDIMNGETVTLKDSYSFSYTEEWDNLKYLYKDENGDEF